MKRFYIPNQTFTGLNNTINVQVLVEEFSGVAAVSLEITYDTQVLHFEKLENTSDLFKCDYNEYSPGYIRVCHVGRVSGISDGSPIFSLKFTTLQATTTTIDFTTETLGLCEIADWDAQILPFNFQDGQITIEN